MLSPAEILVRMAPERFQQVVLASPKKFREELFRQANLKRKSDPFSLKASANGEDRIPKLQEAMKTGLTLQAPVLEELVRNYFYSKRELLGAALDFLEVKHDNGLTNANIDFIQSMSPEKGVALRTKLLAHHDASDVELYLSFMGVPLG